MIQDKEVFELLCDVINQACLQSDNKTLDSMALSSYADAMRYLADKGKLKIKKEAGRRVIAEWIEE